MMQLFLMEMDGWIIWKEEEEAKKKKKKKKGAVRDRIGPLSSFDFDLSAFVCAVLLGSFFSMKQKELPA
jgi:hypothetical protein